VKEFPSVKVLGPAEVPKKKSYPPRLTIIILGTPLSFFFPAIWILGNAGWSETDLHDRRIMFTKDVVSEAFDSIRATPSKRTELIRSNLRIVNLNLSKDSIR
jgi:hypothetical protein